jgi:citrate synthase
MQVKRYLSAREAADALGVTLPTLYSYVSRGILRSEPIQSNTRQHRYRAEDIERLLARREAEHNPEAISLTSLHWGAPILDSAITLIKDGHLYYRGHDVVDLAQNATFEEVASLLWTGDIDHAEELFTPDNRLDASAYSVPQGDPCFRFRMVLPFAMEADFASYNLENVPRTGARIVRLMVDTFTASCRKGNIAEGIADTLNHPQGVALLNVALILCADHELNPSSFAVRIAASAGANPYAIVSAGLATLTGQRQGTNAARVSGFLREVHTPENAYRVVAEHLQRGEAIPGFGHRLYPKGDPRGCALLDYTRRYAPDCAFWSLADAVTEAVVNLVGEVPNIDLGLVALMQCLGAEHISPTVLLAIGRAAGWIGHAIEQYANTEVIRPRARYIGIDPTI